LESNSSDSIAKGDGKSQGSKTCNTDSNCHINIKLIKDNKVEKIIEKFFRKVLIN
jgi:hypothetical protein|tara:strand:+ start:528 stop:692 length:165 start_codon:yes stop_codon:yes gene_type:complete